MRDHADAIAAKASELTAAIDQAMPHLTGECAGLAQQLRNTVRVMRGQIADAAAHVPATYPNRHRLDHGQFRLLFTFEERAQETAFEGAALAARSAGTATPEQLMYLTMREDYRAATHINLDDEAVIAALQFYVAFGLLTAERAAYVLTGWRPGEMPEPDEPEDEGEGDADPA